MLCQKCNQPCWDNSEKVAQGWKGPLAKCKDASCGWILWPPKKDRAQGRAGPFVPREPKWTWAQLSNMYGESLKIAANGVSKMKDVKWLAGPPTAADLIASAATIFIAATRDGVRTEVPLDQPPPGIQDTPDDREIDRRFAQGVRRV